MGKGDKKSKRGKIIMGSFGVRRPSRKHKPGAVAVPKPDEKPAKERKAAEEPVEPFVLTGEQPTAVEKKPVKKASAKKTAEGGVEKPKTARPKKKAAPEGEAATEEKKESNPEQ